jgi:uncharacterized Zn finger protein
MDELWIYCDMCEDESPHEILKSRTSNKRGFSFQGVVQCKECGSKGHAEIKEEPPISLKLRISDDNQTLNGILDVDRGILLKVGQTRPHPDGLIVITSLELTGKRPDKAFSQEMPTVWAKRATHTKVRFAIHEGESTISLKQEFDSDAEFYVGMRLQLQGRDAKVRSINLFGGRTVKSSFASEISRVTCFYLPEKKYRRAKSKINGRRD